MDNENEFEIEGVMYISVVVTRENGCHGCDMQTRSYGCAANLFPVGRVPNCEPQKRNDGVKVIFRSLKE